MLHALRLHLLPLFFILLTPVLSLAATLDSSRFHDLQGRPHSVTELRGQMVLVNFWATWCGPCRQEMPMLDRLQQTWAKRGIRIVGIALDDKPAVSTFVRQQKIRYPIWMGDDQTMDLLPLLGNAAIGLPFTVLLDRQGRRVASWTGQLSEPLLQKALAPYR